MIRSSKVPNNFSCLLFLFQAGLNNRYEHTYKLVKKISFHLQG
jgi:hypothetical protein